MVKWFFPDGLDGLAQKVWAAYHDDPIESDILGYLYLSSEPIMGACVAEALFPLQEGIVIPSKYFDRFLNEYLGTQPSPKTRKRLKMNLVKLGFLKPLRPEGHRLNPMTPTKTAFWFCSIIFSRRLSRGPSNCEIYSPIRSGSTSASSQKMPFVASFARRTHRDSRKIHSCGSA